MPECLELSRNLGYNGLVMNKLLTISAISVLALSFVSCAEEPAWDTTVEIGPYTVSLVEKDVWHV